MVTYFKEEWLSDPLFEKSKCRTYQVQLNLSNMGWRALTSHMERKNMFKSQNQYLASSNLHSLHPESKKF